LSLAVIVYGYGDVVDNVIVAYAVYLVAAVYFLNVVVIGAIFVLVIGDLGELKGTVFSVGYGFKLGSLRVFVFTLALVKLKAEFVCFKLGIASVKALDAFELYRNLLCRIGVGKNEGLRNGSCCYLVAAILCNRRKGAGTVIGYRDLNGVYGVIIIYAAETCIYLVYGVGVNTFFSELNGGKAEGLILACGYSLYDVIFTVAKFKANFSPAGRVPS